MALVMVTTDSANSSSNASIPNYLCHMVQWIGIPLESGETYLFWKAQMENFFRIHHLYEIISSSQSIPQKRYADGSINPLYENWLQKNRIALGWIHAAVGPPMFSLVMNHDTAIECWKTLEMHFSPCKTSHYQITRDRLMRLDLLKAVKSGEESQLRQILDSQNVENHCMLFAAGKNNILHIAAKFGSFECAQIICNLVSSTTLERLLNQPNSIGNTPLQYATLVSEVELVELFVGKMNDVGIM